jgi:hyperosmotically inducible protein
MFRRFVDTACFASWLGLAILLAAPAALAQQTPPDNTEVNKRDRAASQPTADQQKNDRSDVAITRDIRRAIVNDKTLSTYARNIKVITQNGAVTLKGPVRTEDEKKVVEAKATDVAGAGHVDNQISVTNAPSKRRAKLKA